MAFLTDILGKKNEKLNFRTRPIGFREDRKKLCVVPRLKQSLKKTRGKAIIEKDNNINLKLS